MKLIALACLTLFSAAAHADDLTPEVRFAGHTADGTPCALQVYSQSEEMATVQAIVGPYKFNFYNYPTDWENRRAPQLDELFDANFHPIIGAPILWFGRLNDVTVELQKENGQLTGFTLDRHLTVGFGKIPVGHFTVVCR